MKCKLCSNKNFDSLFEVDGFEIGECSNCGLVKTFGEYKVDYSRYHRDQDYELHEELFRNIFKKRLDIVKKYVDKGKVLEIGTAVGTMLDLFKEDGWETWGVEPSGSAGVASKKGHKILKTTFEKAKLDKNYFDAVVINHTLEHVENPVGVLKKVKTLLKKGGIVYIDVPNFASLASRTMSKNWGFLLPEEHVHHFTPKTLKGVMREAGLKKVWEDTWSGVYDVDNVYRHFFTQLTSGKLYMYKNLVFDVLGIPGNILATSLNRGTSLAMIGRKV